MMDDNGKPGAGPKRKHDTSVDLPMPEGRTRSQTMAELQVKPTFRNAYLGQIAGGALFSAESEKAEFLDTYDALGEVVSAAKTGDIAHVSAALAAQAVSLDAIYTDLARRSLLNIGQHFDAAMKLMGMALRAQANARATAEVLAKIHQPREQTVHHRHYHVGPDGKAVFVENWNGGQGNVESGGQPFGTALREQYARARGPGALLSGECPTMLGEDPQRNGVPIAGHAERALPDTRGQVAGSAEGQQEQPQARALQPRRDRDA